jgi:anti-sigma factor RsiW
MNCAEFESILADYVDGTLGATESAAVELHAAECSSCREFMDAVTGAVKILGRVEEIEPPAELITRIAYQTPRGRTSEGLDVPGFWAELKRKWLAPLLQPRLAMGMAMTVLSFSMLARCTGVPVQHLQAADLNPARVLGSLEDRVLRTKERLVKDCENLRVVYEIEARLNEMDKQSSSSSPSKALPQKQQPSSVGPKTGGQK